MDLKHTDLKIKSVVETKVKGTYHIEPLPKGFGSTMGNALRRVLLSSLSGAAVTQMKIKGVSHQFTTVPGVKEDVVEVSLNVKQIRVKLHTKETTVATISKKGPGKVTAGDIKASSDVEILNPDLHIATLADSKSVFEAELIIEPGVGYSPMEERITTKVGYMSLDASFSPVTHVHYEVEPTRYGKNVDLDKIVLNVETDGTFEPLVALKSSAKLLKEYFTMLEKGELENETEVVAEVKTKAKSKVSDNIAIEDLPLQTRTVNALKKSGIDTLAKLAKLSEEDLMDVKNLGEKSLTEIKKLLEKENLR